MTRDPSLQQQSQNSGDTMFSISLFRDPWIRRSALLIGGIFAIWIAYEDTTNPFNSSSRTSSSSIRSTTSYCVDVDEPPGWERIEQKTRCKCPDPTTPLVRSDSDAWMEHHDVMVQDVAYAVAEGRKLDVVLLGDSITERWNGTRSMGRNSRPEFRKVFDEFFGTQADVRGLALGTSGDINVELMWHLQNGFLPDLLRPKVWFLLIGTNDLGRSGCSKRTTLAGIFEVLQFLQSKRPQTPIIVHGLLPRNDFYANENEQKDFSLGRYWNDIVWINRGLKAQCDGQTHLHYMEVNNLFLFNNESISRETMSDALHPSVEGYRLWAPHIVKKIQQLEH